jgi:signal transduction histidine kinase
LKCLFAFSFLLIFVSCNREENNWHNPSKLDRHFAEAYNLKLSREERVKHVDSAYRIVNQHAVTDSLKLKNVFKVANRYFTLLQYEDYFKTSKNALQLSKRLKDTLQIAKAEYYLGDYYFYKFQNDSAYYFYLRAKDKYEKSTDQYNLAVTTLHIARVLLFEKDFLGSEIETINALKIAKEIGDNELIYQCYDNLGRVLEGQKNFKKSLEYYFKSLEYLKRSDVNVNSLLLEVQAYNNIGHVFLNAKYFEQALESYKKALQVKETKELHPGLYASVLSLYAYTNFKLKNGAINDFKTALKIRDSINDIAGKINSRIHLTEYYLEKKDTLKAKVLNQEAYQLAKASNYNKEVLTTLDFFTKIEPKKGLQYAQEYIKLSDSLQEQERNTRNKLARIEFETDQIIIEKEAITNKLSTIVLISLVLFSIGSLLYVILYLRNREKQLLLDQQQQQANEKIYQMMLEQQSKIDEARISEKRRIARELHDGIMNKLASTRLNLFVLNKRKDEETIEKCLPHINEIQNIEKEVRSIAHELTNATFVENNFKNVLTDFLTGQKQLFDNKFEFTIEETISWETIDTKVKMNLYRILQEALQNIYKYAQAQNVWIIIYKEEESIVVSIEDNGKGFNLNKKKKGIGIQNMYERAKAIQADFNIITKENKGTKIMLTLPKT